ncbi:hypothetical protein [Kribbella sp. CA-247076]|uniref:hypothetical protein n=1 Tax=Kribbella sp. CA-247076 TaxID=3239941 RepID=UPI003D8ADA9F
MTEFIAIDRESVQTDQILHKDDIAQECSVRLIEGGSVVFQAKADARGELTYHIHPSGALYVRIGGYNLRVFGPNAWIMIEGGSEAFAAETQY